MYKYKQFDHEKSAHCRFFIISQMYLYGIDIISTPANLHVRRFIEVYSILYIFYTNA